MDSEKSLKQEQKSFFSDAFEFFEGKILTKESKFI